MVFAFERLAGISNSSFHIGFYSDARVRVPSWYTEFSFSLLDSIVIVAFARVAGISNSRFHIIFIVIFAFERLAGIAIFFSHWILWWYSLSSA